MIDFSEFDQQVEQNRFWTEPIEDVNSKIKSTVYNTGYMAHFVRPNRLTPTSYSPISLGEIIKKEGSKWTQD